MVLLYQIETMSIYRKLKTLLSQRLNLCRYTIVLLLITKAPSYVALPNELLFAFQSIFLKGTHNHFKSFLINKANVNVVTCVFNIAM